MTFQVAEKSRRINWRTFFYCIFLAFGCGSYGYSASIISTTLAQPPFLIYMDLMDAQGHLSSNESALAGTTVGLFCAGGCFGAILGSWAVDTFGRRYGTMAFALLAIVASVIVAAAQNIAMFIVGRFIAGFASIAFIGINATYITELAQAEVRGVLVGLTGLAIAFGYTTAAYMGLAFSYYNNPTAQWRAPLAIAIVFPLVLLIALCFTPESPRYLLLKDKSDQALEILRKIHRTRADPDEEYIKEEFFQMRKQIEYDRTLDSSWRVLFTRPSYRKRLYMSCGTIFLAQSTGVLVAAAYGPTLYAALGFGLKDQIILQCGWITGSIPAAIAAISLMDKFGRRPFIVTGLIGCIIALSFESAMQAVYAPTAKNQVGLGWGVAALYMIVIFYCLGVEACGYVFYSEIFPTHIRAKGVCFTSALSSAVNLLYLEVAPSALKTIGWKFLLIFVIILVIGTAVFWTFVPETKGIPLEELAAIFGDEQEVQVFSEDIQINAKHEVVLRNQETVQHSSSNEKSTDNVVEIGYIEKAMGS